MSQRPHDLFRQEALAARADNSAGPALRIRPVGATRLTVFFAAMAVLVILLLIFGCGLFCFGKLLEGTARG